MDEGAAGQRLRDDGALSRTDRKVQPRLFLYFAPHKYVADPHIDDADEGMTADRPAHRLRTERQLVPMAKAICEQPATDDASSTANFCQKQPSLILPCTSRSVWATISSVAGSTSPTISFRRSIPAGDVRITTRVNENDLGDALFNAARGRPRHVRARYQRCARWHAALQTGVRPASMKASRGSGRTWWRAAACFGSTSSTRCCSDVCAAVVRCSTCSVPSRHQ